MIESGRWEDRSIDKNKESGVWFNQVQKTELNLQVVCCQP